MQSPDSPTRADLTVELTIGEARVLDQTLRVASSATVADRLGCSPEAVEAEISSILRKTCITGGVDATVTLLEEDNALRISGVTIPCKPTSFGVLSYLIERRGHWVRSETLRSEVLRTSVQYSASNVRWHVLQARRALGRFAPLLHSDNRLGFMFEMKRCTRPHCAPSSLAP
jgi:DNA-binding CsgD family transcriptional regulator